KSGSGQIDTGYISQNVYLFCASFGLGTVARGSFDKALTADMKLTDKQQITLVQPVGAPK
ncbi:MAG: nitroreductase family protein, partial [Prevotella sp.]|nr:nitroreductase family protein [Prevotella sp.]